MSIEFTVACSEQHFEQILQLQQQNLISAINEERQSKEGFVFAEHTLPLLKEMATHLPQVVALYQGQVIGYNLTMLASMKNIVTSLIPMFDEFEKSYYKGRLLTEYKFMVGGQVCVDKAFRGQDLLKKLYYATRDRLSQDYQVCVTEIAGNNPISFAAHNKMGFETVRSYYDGTMQWDIVAWGFGR